jgi:hypothetical protein
MSLAMKWMQTKRDCGSRKVRNQRTNLGIFSCNDSQRYACKIYSIVDVVMHANIHGRKDAVNTVLPGRPSNFAHQRRSQRVLLAVRLEVNGKRADKTSFMEETRTIIVNSHGALMHLKESVISGQILTLKNDATGEQINCTVVDSFSGQEGVPEVAIEFCEACPRF